MASKWEAFKGRGKNDYRTSKDFEDIVYVLENADDLEEQLQASNEGVKAYLREELEQVINREDFEEGLYARLAGGYGGIDANYIKAKLKSALGI